jgi:hypothetical protein
MRTIGMGASRLCRRGVWTSVFLALGLLAVAAGAFAVGRSTAPNTSPMPYSRSQMAAGMSTPAVSPCVRPHSDSTAGLRMPMGQVPWLRNHEGHLRRMLDDSLRRWTGDHMQDMVWLRDHRDQWWWTRAYPCSRQRMRDHMADMMFGR